MKDFLHERKRALLLAALGVAGVVAVFCLKPSRAAWERCAGVVWNTEYHITYFGDKTDADSLDAVLRSVELSVSPFNKESLVTAINEGRVDTLDAALTAIYLKSVEINRESDGAFDPTLSPLINAWGFGYKNGALPTDAQIDSMLQFTGIDKTRLEGNRLIKPDERMTLNFSAIAKGYGVDEVGRLLVRHGVERFLVEIGGEIVVRGKNSRGESWRVSIDSPTADGADARHESAEIIAVSDCAVATSGNYRNYREDSLGNRYSHIIDPATGRPSRTDVLSATVIAADCMTADACATTLMVLGSERAKAFLAGHKELAAMMIVADGNGIRIWHSDNYKKLIVRQ